MQSFKPKQFPSEADWLLYLEEKKSEIVDGQTDTDFLNRGFLGGWNRCLERFAKNHDFLPWDYYTVQKRFPMDLGGNMKDTDRLAGQLGWRQATDEINRVISSTNESELRNRIFHINYHIALLAGCGAAVLAMSVVWDLANRKARVRHDLPKQGTLETAQ